MKANQGIILLMLAALILWLTWSSNSPLKGTSTSATTKPKDTLTVDPSGKLKPTTDPSFPIIPAEILGPYSACKSSGGEWNFTSNTCNYKG